jgi:Uma2 family endonuclease
MAATVVPIEVYLLSEYEPDAEYVDGEIEERNVGEYGHAAWQRAIQLWFWKHEEEWNVQALPELRIQTSRTRFRVADVAVLDLSAPTSPITTHPPVAVFEVLSPEDRVQRLVRKLGDYARMGVEGIWVIDPETGACFSFENEQLVPRTRLSLPQRGIDFELLRIGELLR